MLRGEEVFLFIYLGSCHKFYPGGGRKESCWAMKLSLQIWVGYEIFLEKTMGYETFLLLFFNYLVNI